MADGGASGEEQEQGQVAHYSPLFVPREPTLVEIAVSFAVIICSP